MYTPPPDKMLHVFAGAVLALLGFAIWPAHWLPAALLCATGAVAREFYNRGQGGAFDWRDIVATLGGGAGIAAAWALGAS
jgi:hypothetical protein